MYLSPTKNCCGEIISPRQQMKSFGSCLGFLFIQLIISITEPLFRFVSPWNLYTIYVRRTTEIRFEENVQTLTFKWISRNYHPYCSKSMVWWQTKRWKTHNMHSQYEIEKKSSGNPITNIEGILHNNDNNKQIVHGFSSNIQLENEHAISIPSIKELSI